MLLPNALAAVSIALGRRMANTKSLQLHFKILSGPVFK